MTQTHKTDGDNSTFKWACLASAVLFGSIVLYMINDLRSDVTRSLDSAHAAVSKANSALGTVNEELPTIVGEVRKGTETLSGLAEDVKLLKSVVGIEKNQRGLRGLAIYANEIEQALAESLDGKNAIIKIEAIIGSSLKDVESAEEFLVGLNKEMVVILALAKSKEEVLWRICHSGPPRRKPYFIAVGDDDPLTLQQYICEIHPESAELPAFEP